MYKLIIVDDEVETRNDLADLINMQDTGFEIAGLFNDGLPVKKYLEKNKVDVIITDIKMPCTNGLDLSEYIYHHYPEIVIIIISGYGEFEYARRSMEYNIKQYLLKPVDFDEMIAVLAKTKEELDEEYRKRKFYQEWEHEKQSEFLRKLYLGLYQDEQQIEKEFEKVYFSFDISSSKGRVIKIVFENYNEFIKGFWKHGEGKNFCCNKEYH